MRSRGYGPPRSAGRNTSETDAVPTLLHRPSKRPSCESSAARSSSESEVLSVLNSVSLYFREGRQLLLDARRNIALGVGKFDSAFVTSEQCSIQNLKVGLPPSCLPSDSAGILISSVSQSLAQGQHGVVDVLVACSAYPCMRQR